MASNSYSRGSGWGRNGNPICCKPGTERAKSAGAPIDVDLSTIAAGTMSTVARRGKPVWVLHRTPQMIISLETAISILADPLFQRIQSSPRSRQSLTSELA